MSTITTNRLDRSAYMQFRSLFSFRPDFASILLFLIIDICMCGAGLTLLSAGTLGYVASQIIFAVVAFHNFAILHECGHESASSHRWLNNVTGHYASLFCCIPYFPWKYIHSEHHAWSGNIDKDPTLGGLKRYRQELETGKEDQMFGVLSIMCWMWRLWLPVFAFVQQLSFWNYPLMLLKLKQLRGFRLYRCLFSMAFIPSTYALLICAFPDVFTFGNFWLAMVLYLAFTELINLPHHLGTGQLKRDEAKLLPWEQHAVTRSCFYPKFFSRWLLLNFNLHTEHHLFPNLPWGQLPKVSKLLKERLGRNYNESIGIAWHLGHRQSDLDDVFGELPENIHIVVGHITIEPSVEGRSYVT